MGDHIYSKIKFFYPYNFKRNLEGHLPMIEELDMEELYQSQTKNTLNI